MMQLPCHAFRREGEKATGAKRGRDRQTDRQTDRQSTLPYPNTQKVQKDAIYWDNEIVFTNKRYLLGQ